MQISLSGPSSSSWGGRLTAQTYPDEIVGGTLFNYTLEGIQEFTVLSHETKFFDLGGDAPRLGLFAEFYNLTNKANFGNNFQGNALAENFRQPIGFMSGGAAYPTSRQMQLGARFSF